MRCANYELEKSRLWGKINSLKVVVAKFEGERDKIKSPVEMMTR